MNLRDFRTYLESILRTPAKGRAKPRRLTLFLELLETRVLPTAYTWVPTAAGPFDWNNAANWTPNTGFPNAVDDVANVTSALAANQTINLNVPITVGTLNIGAASGTNPFTIAASGGSLTLGVSTGSASITKTAGGADQITAGLTLSNNLTIADSTTSALTFSGTIVSTLKTLAINPGSQTGEVDFTVANAVNTGNIAVAGGTLGLNSITVSKSRVLTIAAAASVKSSGTLSLTADGSVHPGNWVTGSGTLRLVSTTNSATTPDLYFAANDSDNSTANWGTEISANIDLGSSQRYIYGKTNHDAFGVYGESADAYMKGAISGSGGITFIGQDNFAGSNPMEVPFVLAGANTFTGELEIQRGSVYLNNASALAQNNALVMDPAPGNNARLFLNGFNATVSNLSSSGGGNAAIANGNRANPATSIGPATLTINQNSAAAFGGLIADIVFEYSSSGSGTTGGLSIDKKGSATLTLTNNNTFTGGTTVEAGALLLNNTPALPADSGIGTGNVTVNTGGIFGGTGSVVLAGGKAIVDNGGLHPTGNSATGQLTTGDLTLANGTFTVDLNGALLGNGYNQVVSNGTVTLTNETLAINANFAATGKTTFDILSSINNPIVGTFNGAPEGSTVTFNGQSFTITYVGGAGNDVVLTRQTAPIVYVDSKWTGLGNGTPIADADPVAAGAQPATIGTSAFASVNAAIAAVPALGMVIVNGSYTGGGSGNFTEDVVVNKEINLLIQAGPTSFNSLADSVASSVVTLGVDTANAPITLTTGASNASTTILGSITGGGNLVKMGTGTMIVSGIDIYSGTTTVSAGTLQAGSATGLATSSAYTVNGTLTLNGFSDGVASLAGSGTVQNANAAAATLTVNVPAGGSTFSGVLRDGAGGGPLNLATQGAGTFTLGTANTYTGSTTVDGGSVLSVSVLANGGSPSSIGASTSDPGNLVLQSGSTLLYSGGTTSTDRGFTLGSSGGTLTETTSATTLTMGGNIANGVNALTLGGAGNLSFGGVFTGTTGTLTDSGPGNVTFTNGLAFGTTNNATVYGSITTGNIAVNGGDMTVGNLRLNEDQRPGTVREVAIGSGAILTITGTLAIDPSGSSNVTQVAGPGTLQLRNPAASKTNPSMASDFGPSGGDGGPDGTIITAFVDIGNAGTQWIVGKTNRNDVSRYAGDLRFDAPISGSAGLQLVGTNTNSSRNFHFVLNTDNSGSGGAAPFTGPVFIANADLDLTNDNALTAANSVTFDGTNDTNTTNTSVLYLWGHNVTIGSLNDTSDPATTSLIRNGALDLLNGGTPSLGVQADSTLTIDQTAAGIFNGKIDDGPNDNNTGAIAAFPHLYRTLSIVKTGPATLTLTGSNAYTGTTAISGGVLSVASLANGGILQSAITNATESGSDVTITTATPNAFQVGENVTIAGVATGYNGTFAVTGITNATTFSYTATATGLADASTGTAYPATLGLGIGPSPSGIGSSSNSAANLVLDGGTLQYTGPATSTDRLFTVTGNGGSIDASGSGALAFTNASGAVVFSGATATTLTLTGSTPGNTLAPVLADGGGATTVVKNGAGTWDLAGADTYTGPTSVNAGTLLVDGSLKSPVTVAAGATLAGSGGTIAAPVAVSGTLSAGNGVSSTGKLAVGNLSFGSGGTGAMNILLNGAAVGTGYDQINGKGTINLSMATLNLSVGVAFLPPAGSTFDILLNTAGAAITGTFIGLPQGATVTAGGRSFTIGYTGGAGGHDVVLTFLAAAFTYADTAWAGMANGTVIPDADPVTPGMQPATIGTNAFASVNAAIAAAPALSTVIVNGHYTGGGSGIFAEDVTVNKQVALLLQGGPTTFNSLADSSPSSVIILGADATNIPITLTTGGDNADTTVAAPIAGSGGLTKAGTGTMILSGNDGYTGPTVVSAGNLQAGSASAFSSTSAYTVSGTLTLNGFSAGIASLTGSGTIQDANAAAATLTVGVPGAGSTFSGLLRDGVGGGAFSLVLIGTGTFTLSGTQSTYTGSTTAMVNLNVAALANSGSPSSIGSATSDPGNLVLQGVTLTYTGAAASTDRGFTLGTGGATLTSATALTIGGNIANGASALILGGTGNLSFGGVFTGTTGTLTVNGPGNTVFTNPLAFGTTNNETVYGSITTGNITVNGGDLTVGNLRLNEDQRPGTVREVAIGSGAFLTVTGTLALDPSGNTYLPQVAGPGTLQLRNPSASATNPSLASDFGPSGGDGGPWGTNINAPVDVGNAGTQWIVGKTNRNDVSRYAGDLRFDAPLSGSAGLQVVGANVNNNRNFHFVLNADNSGTGGAAPFTGPVFIANADLDLANNNALTAANSVTFDGTNDPNTTNTSVLYLWGHNVTIGSLNDTSDPATRSFVRNGSLDTANGGTNSNGSGATNGAALGLQADSTLTINQTAAGTFNGQINDGRNDNDIGATGTYRTLSIVKTGSATLSLTGNSAYSGSTTISAGVLSVSSLADGGTTVANGLGNSPSGIGSSDNTPMSLVLDGGTLQYTGLATSTDRAFTVTAKGGTLDASGSGALAFTNGGSILFNGGQATTFTLAGSSTADNSLALSLIDGSAPTTLIKTGTGTWSLAAANTYTGPTNVNAGELLVDGSVTSTVTVAATATLGGSGGTVTAPVSVGGTLTAGDVGSTGKLTVGNLSFSTGGTYNPVLAGTAAGTGYDQVTGTGTVNLTSAALKVNFAGGFSPAVGSTYDILVGSGGAITGTFTGLPEGATVAAFGNTFKISYVGGASHHDVVLTTLTAVTASKLIISNLSSTSITAGGTVTFTVTAEDSTNNPVTGYTATVKLTSTDTSAVFGGTTLPANYTFVASDNGAHTFTVTLKTAGSKTITLTDQVNSLTVTTSPITVASGEANKLIIGVMGGNTEVAGNAFVVTAQAADQFGNAVSSYSGPSSIMATVNPADPQSNFPLTGTLNSSGLGLLLGNLATVGTYTLTATAGAFSGTSTLTVTPSAAFYFTVTAPAAATTGAAMNVTVKAFDRFGNATPGYTGTVGISSTDPAISPVTPYHFLAADNGVHTFSVTLNSSTLASGNGTLIIARDTSATAPPITGFSAPAMVQGLVVPAGGFVKTATGFTVTFSKPFTPADLTMYGLNNTTVQDVTMTGAHIGKITGTLYQDPTTPSTLVFKASNAYLQDINLNTVGDKDSVALPDDTYTVTLKSGTGSNGFVDALGSHLDGAGNGGTSNFTQTFATTFQDDAHANASPVPVLAIPDFARGPDSATTVTVPILDTGNSATHGIPITLYNAAGVTDATFTLTYNPLLLTPTAGGTGDSTAAGSTFTMGAITSVDSTHSMLSFTYHNATAKSGTVILGDITATVPSAANAIYKTKELLALSGITVNGGATVQAANGIHVDAYVGDVHVTALPAIDASDALDAQKVASGPTVASGFPAYGLLDPAIIGAFVPGSLVTVGPADVTALFSKAVHLPVASLPSIPASMTSVNVSGADPTVSLAGTVQATNGIVSVPVMLDHPHPDGSTGMTEAHLALIYDPSVLSVSSSDITLGSIPGLGAGWQITSEVDAATGQIGINLFNLARTPITATQAGSLVNIAFHVVPGAVVPATAVQLVNQVAPNGQRFVTDVDDSQGPLTLSPGMDRLVLDSGVQVGLAWPGLRYSEGPAHGDGAAQSNTANAAVASAYLSSGQEIFPDTLEETTVASLPLLTNGTRGETGHGIPADLVVSGALAFQSNQSSVAATQVAGQVFQIGNAPLANAILGAHSPQQLADRLFLALARGTDALAEFNSLSLFQDNLRDVATHHPNWLALANRPATTATDAAAGTLLEDGTAGQAVSDHLAVVDRVFADLADDTDVFSDFGDY